MIVNAGPRTLWGSGVSSCKSSSLTTNWMVHASMSMSYKSWHHDRASYITVIYDFKDSYDIILLPVIKFNLESEYEQT